MDFDELPEFQRDRKRLAKKYRSLTKKYRTLTGDSLNDLQLFQKVVSNDPLGKESSQRFDVIDRHEGLPIIVKARLACQDLKGKDLRVIYAYFEQGSRIEFIELYYKGDKENHNRRRVENYLAKYRR